MSHVLIWHTLLVWAVLVSIGTAQSTKPIEKLNKSNSSKKTTYRFPASEWQTSRPEKEGMVDERLKIALEYAGSKQTKAVVIVRNGKIVAEKYWDGWNQNSTGPLYSASKSLTGTLVGIAIDLKKLKSVEQPVCELIKEWDRAGGYRDLKIKHLLSLTSGLENSRRIFVAGNLVRDQRKYVTNLEFESKPGSKWSYHNSAYRLLFDVLEEATDQKLERFCEANLFKPIGITTANWNRNRGGKVTFVEMSARDAARFGLLALKRGEWDGRQLVSQSYLKQSVTPFDAQVNPSYGFLWWLNGGSRYYLPLRERPVRSSIFPDCPPDTFAALGKDDQKIYVVPSLDLVAVRLGDAANKRSAALTNFDNEFLSKICDAVNNQKAVNDRE